jgi:short-subunit dehydrogenase
MSKISGSVVIITGASSGIGRATALVFAKNKAKAVVIASRSAEKLVELKKEIETLGVSTLAIPTDVSNQIQAQEMAEKTIEEFGSIDILANCAGVFFSHSALYMDYKNLHETFDTNFFGTVYCTQSVLSNMVKQGQGQIVTLSSTAFTANPPFHTSYSSSKYAVVGYSRGVRRELENCGIKVLIVHPGLIDTPMLAGDIASMQQPMRLDIVKVIKPEKVANEILVAIEKGKKEIFPGIPRGYNFLNSLTGGRLADYMVGRVYGGCKVKGEDKEWHP